MTSDNDNELANYHVQTEAVIDTTLTAHTNQEAIEQFEQAHGDFIEGEINGMSVQIKIKDIEAHFDGLVDDE